MGRKVTMKAGGRETDGATAMHRADQRDANGSGRAGHTRRAQREANRQETADAMQQLHSAAMRLSEEQRQH